MRYIAVILVLMLVLTGCSAQSSSDAEAQKDTSLRDTQSSAADTANEPVESTGTQDTEETTQPWDSGETEDAEVNESDIDKLNSYTELEASDMFTDRDINSDYNEEVVIKLKGDTAESSSKTVQIGENSITLTEDADYLISGSYNGSIIVSADKSAKPRLILDSVNITSKDSAALYIKQADKVIVTLRGNNSLKNAEGFTEQGDDNIDGAVFSKDDLSFNGNGSLSVDSPNGHGIVAKDDLVFTGGIYNVSTADHGIDANDSVRIGNSVINIDSGKDGIHCENTDDAEKGFIYVKRGKLDIESEGDGISASAYITVDDIEFDAVTGGGSVNGAKQSSDGWGGYMGGHYGGSDTTDSESIKGIKAAGNIILNAGIYNIDSADDAIHSNTAITVNSGNYEISSGDDGFHADDTLVINNGNITVNESYEGLEAYEVTVNDADITLYASDDGINAAGGNDQSGYGGRDNGGFGGFGGMMGDNGGVITVNGGSLYINAGGDAVDSNGELYMNGGDVVISGPNYGDTSILDYATEAVITGGSFIGCGSVGMDGCFDSTSTQGAIMISVSGSQNTSVILTDSEGNIIIEHTPDRDFNCIVLSHPDIAEGESYVLRVGNESYDITMTSIIYRLSGGYGGGYGGPGGGHGGPEFMW